MPVPSKIQPSSVGFLDAGRGIGKWSNNPPLGFFYAPRCNPGMIRGRSGGSLELDDQSAEGCQFKARDRVRQDHVASDTAALLTANPEPEQQADDRVDAW
jgi:hypothetical protein